MHWIACHFNPLGYQRPVDNLRRFLDGMRGRPGTLVVLELSDRIFPDIQTTLSGITTIRLSIPRDTPPFWWKEGLLNFAMEHLPPGVETVAVLDADIEFLDPDWQTRAEEALWLHPVIHPWHRVRYTDEHGLDACCRASTGYGASVRSLDEWIQYHPGCAWAFRTSFLREIGGWYVSPISHGDTLMALACTGRLTENSPRLQKLSPAHRADILRWGARVTAAAGGTIGYSRGEIRHWWHGHESRRRYADLPSLIQDYDPATDLSLPQGTPPGWSASAIMDKPHMVSAVADYFRDRDEDGAAD